MVEALKSFARKIFKLEKQPTESILKTRAQLIAEGRGAYIPKRHIHGTPHFKHH